jgi:phospholipid transport system substrate-binding protein
MKGFIYSILFILVFSPPAAAGRTAEVETLLREKIDKVLIILKDKERAKAERDDSILKVVTPVFDFELMAKLSLGKKHWPGLPVEKRGEYSDVFIEKMKESYLEKLDLYDGEDMIYDPPIEKGKKVHMRTYLDLKDSKMEMLYKFYKSRKGWLIYDLEIEGVSTVQTYRSQFDGVLRDGTIDDLIEKLKNGEKFSDGERKK